MGESLVMTQAKQVSALLPALMRQLLSGDDDPAAELPLAQLRVCGALYHGPRSMSVLSRELRVSLSATTQIANRLVHAGLVSRLAEGADRRVRRLQLTPRGLEIMQFREQARCDRISAALEHLTLEKRQEVVSALSSLRDACRMLEADGEAMSAGVGTRGELGTNEASSVQMGIVSARMQM